MLISVMGLSLPPDAARSVASGPPCPASLLPPSDYRAPGRRSGQSQQLGRVVPQDGPAFGGWQAGGRDAGPRLGVTELERVIGAQQDAARTDVFGQPPQQDRVEDRRVVVQAP